MKPKWTIIEYEYLTCPYCGDSHYTSCDSTQEAKEMLESGDVPNFCSNCGKPMTEEALKIQAKQENEKWIPFTFRPPTEEEKEKNPNLDLICDCKVPNDMQEVLISYRDDVFSDVFDIDAIDDSIGLENYGEIKEGMAWQQLPKSYESGARKNETE